MTSDEIPEEIERRLSAASHALTVAGYALLELEGALGEQGYSYACRLADEQRVLIMGARDRLTSGIPARMDSEARGG